MKTLYALLVVAALVALVVSHLYSSNQYVSGLLTNISTELLGILITVSIVQFLVNRYRQAETLRLSQRGFIRIGDALYRLLRILAILLKGAADKSKTIRLDCVNDLRNVDLLKEFSYLDIGLPWSQSDPSGHTYAEELSSATRNLKDEFWKTLDVYSAFFPSDYMKKIDELLSNEYLEYLDRIGPMIRKERRDYPNRTVLAPTAGMTERRVFFNQLCDLVSLHNDYSNDPLGLPDRALSDGAFPGWGDLRIEGPFRPIEWVRRGNPQSKGNPPTTVLGLGQMDKVGKS